MRDSGRLPVTVTTENGADVVELLVNDKIGCLPNLSLARFAVTDDAVDSLVDSVGASGERKARRYRQSLTERTGGGVEERETLSRVGMAVQNAVQLAQCREIVDR